jgi:Flp pilus assembly protein TadG
MRPDIKHRHSQFFLPPLRRVSTGRVASAAMELLLLLPIVLILVFGMIELGMIFAARERLTAACRDGARVAALGGDEREIERAVRRHLGTSALNDALIEMRIRNALGRPVPAGAPVLVEVRAPANLAAPDLLSMIGFSLRNQVIEVRAIMRKE